MSATNCIISLFLYIPYVWNTNFRSAKTLFPEIFNCHETCFTISYKFFQLMLIIKNFLNKIFINIFDNNSHHDLKNWKQTSFLVLFQRNNKINRRQTRGGIIFCSIQLKRRQKAENFTRHIKNARSDIDNRCIYTKTILEIWKREYLKVITIRHSWSVGAGGEKSRLKYRRIRCPTLKNLWICDTFSVNKVSK